MALPNGTQQLADRLASTVPDLVPDIASLIEAQANRIRDELLHPVAVGPVATKLIRTWYGTLTTSPSVATISLPMIPEFWVVRIETSATILPYTITQSGGDEIGATANVNRVQRYVIPGTYNEINITGDGTAAALFYIVTAIRGYPTDVM